MARQIDIKGIRDGLLIRVNDQPEFAVYERLARELEQKRAFLQGSRIAVALGRRAMNGEQLAGLQELFTAHDLELWAVLSDDGDTRDAARELGLATRLSGSATALDGTPSEAAHPESANGAGATKAPPAANALLLRETLRSGRAVWHLSLIHISGRRAGRFRPPVLQPPDAPQGVGNGCRFHVQPPSGIDSVSYTHLTLPTKRIV